ncbi:MAG TPA: universal stress protein UspA [Arenimonas sp.]|nr:universal stress protein UspA [Arenimonas sp.]
MSEQTPLIHANGRVLAALDPSVYADSVTDHAAWAASRLGAPLDLVHVIDRRHGAAAGTNLSGSLSLGAQEDLLQELARLDEQRGRVDQARGRLLLDQARTRAAQAFGVEAQPRQRQGTLVDTLLELEQDVRLFVVGKRGEHADFASGHLGSNLERLVRSVHRPVLVASRALRAPARFLIAFDGSATTRRCVDMVCASPLLRGLACDVLMAGEASAEHQAQMNWALETLRAAGFQPEAQVQAGTPDAVIAEVAKARGADLLVMGAYGHSRIRNLIVGSTTTQVLRACPLPVLLLR